MFTYITYDTDGFVTAYQNTEATGFTKAFVLDSWIVQFSQYPTKFRYDTTSGALLNPGNLPDLSLAELNTKYGDVLATSQQATQAATTLAQQQTNAASSISQLQQAVTTLAVQQASTKEEA